jgi:hypothetical protein
MKEIENECRKNKYHVQRDIRSVAVIHFNEHRKKRIPLFITRKLVRVQKTP